jgi:hypothetical protein
MRTESCSYLAGLSHSQADPTRDSRRLVAAESFHRMLQAPVTQPHRNSLGHGAMMIEIALFI